VVVKLVTLSCQPKPQSGIPSPPSFTTTLGQVATLATCPNVVVKLGGLGMPLCGFGWHERVTPPNSTELAEAMAPYYLWCIEQFGVDRCMFESNFPVDKQSYSYTIMWNSFKRISKDFSLEDRAALFHDTAVKVYRLGTNHEE